MNEEDTTHAGFCCINGANGGWVIRHQFSQVGGACGNALGEPFKVSEVVTKVGGESHTVLVGVGDAKLKCAKELSASQDGRPHEPELTKDALPLLKANVLFVPNFVKDGKDPSFAVVHEFKGAQGRVKDPAKDFLALHPATITFEGFLF